MAQGGIDVPVDEVVQLVAWHLLRHCFCGTTSEVNWREMLKACCSETEPHRLSQKSRQLLKVVAVVCKLVDDDCATNSKKLSSIVELLGDIKDFPEFVAEQGLLSDLQMEAKCQVVLCYLHCGDVDGSKEKWKTYFDTVTEETNLPLATDTLQLVQGWGEGRFTASQRQFKKKHTFAKFKDELLSLLKITVPKMGEPRLQQGLRARMREGRYERNLGEGQQMEENLGEELERGTEENSIEGEEMEDVSPGDRGEMERGTEENPVEGEEMEDVSPGDIGEMERGTEENPVEGEEMERASETVADEGGEVEAGGGEKKDRSGQASERAVREQEEPQEDQNGSIEEEIKEEPPAPTEGEPGPSRGRRSLLAGSVEGEGEEVEWSGMDDSASDDIGDVSHPKKKKLLVARSRKFWTSKEIHALTMGVQRYGVGHWANIKRSYSNELKDRSNVDLKDKWRNMRSH